MRGSNPFAPSLRGGKVTPPSNPVVRHEEAATPDDVLGQMRRVDLVKVAEERGLKTYGTREQVLARIRASETQG